MNPSTIHTILFIVSGALSFWFGFEACKQKQAKLMLIGAAYAMAMYMLGVINVVEKLAK